MKTQDKLDAIKDATIIRYENKLSHDDICGAVLPLALEKGIGFGEISSLVKNIGENNGFITKLKDRQANCLTDIETDLSEYDNYDIYMKHIAGLADVYNVPKNWVKNKLNELLKKNNISVPEKSEILEWQKAMVDCFIANPGMNKSDVHDCVIKYKKETSIPKSMLAMLQYMHKQLVQG